MNAPRRLHRARRPTLREWLRACLFLGALVINLGVLVAIALQTRGPLHVAQGVPTLVVLLAALP